MRRIDTYTCRYMDTRSAVAHVVVRRCTHRATRAAPPPELRGVFVGSSDAMLAVPLRHRDTGDERFVIVAYADARQAADHAADLLKGGPEAGATGAAGDGCSRTAMVTATIDVPLLIGYAALLRMPLVIVLGTPVPPCDAWPLVYVRL